MIPTGRSTFPIGSGIRRPGALLLLVLAAAVSAGTREETRELLTGPDPLAGWQARSFAGETRYAPAREDGEVFVRAHARGSASGRYRELDLPTERWPRLAWSWSVDAPVPVTDVRSREGDDFAARVYVVFSGGWAFWRTTTLVYVWATADAPETVWPNPFTDQAAMFAATRGPAPAERRWVDVERDLVADYERAFGRSPPPIAAVAIMTDTDQTGAVARARYARLRLLGASRTDQASSR